MSLNIGTAAVEAARELGASEHFAAVRDGVLECARKMMNHALDCPAEQKADAVGYARALRDVYLALESAATSKPMAHVEKPGMEARRAAR